MAEEQQHYIPRCLLKHFKDVDGLFELDKQANIVRPRAIQKSAQETNIYPQEIERGRMQKWDDALNKLLTRRIHQGDTIKMAECDKESLIELIAVFMLRVPDNRQRCGMMVQSTPYNRKEEVRELLLNRGQHIARYKREQPEEFDRFVKKIGRKKTENLLIYQMQQSILAGRIEVHKTPEAIFRYMLSSGNHLKYLGSLRKLNWTWIRTEHEFVIGDNPVCRTKKGAELFNYGIGLPDVEITFPLGSHLSLMLHRGRDFAAEAVADEKDTKRINRRQIRSAQRMVYGPSVSALKPDAKHGFE